MISIRILIERESTQMETLSSPQSQTQHFLSTNISNNTQKFPPRVLPTRLGVTVKTDKISATHKVFDEIPVTDTFAWNTLIQSYLNTGDFDHAVLTYKQMFVRGVCPDKHTLPRILAASRLCGSLSLGKQLHGHVIKFGLFSDCYVISELIEMYGCLDGVDSANWLFDKLSRRNPVSWTMLISLYLRENKPRSVIDLFKKMVILGVGVDSVALASVITACRRLKSLHDGKNVHEIARNFGLEFNVLVSNSLLQMYIDCGSTEDGREFFDQMPVKDVISWTTIIRGYVKKGGFNEGLKLFRQMNKDGIKPDELSISTVLPACARVAAGKHGKEIHGYLIRKGIETNIKVLNAIMDMYVKSGFIEYAMKIFAKMNEKDAISWTVMILGHSLHGKGKLGVELFHKMENDMNAETDALAYSAVLHACTTACMVEEGKFYFNCIKAPNITHCTMMVALLARAGLFGEAIAFIEKWQLERCEEVLKALLDGCRMHQERKLGKRIADQLADLKPLVAENYVTLSNWYAHCEKWDMVEKYKETIRDMGLKPHKAYSWIEFQNKVHVFGTGDVSHPRSERIYWELNHLMEKMHIDAYQDNLDFSLHDVDEERECTLIGHSEMLAVSFGLISKQAGTTIRVTKNHRFCPSCHCALKVISKLEAREIIVKDPFLFHHFKDGTCSCCDLY